MGYLGYIESLGGDGWLRVKFDDGKIWPLPEYLRVRVGKEAEGREAFEVLEGRWAGKKASVKKRGFRWGDWNDESYFETATHLSEGCPHTEEAVLTFYIKLQKLVVRGLGEFKTITYEHNPVPVGLHDLEIPYEPHPGGANYTGQAQYAKTWFRIGHSGDRFLHCGRASAGCITVTDIGGWDRIYKHLIVARKGFDNVGTVNVIDA